jgi:hypothetical protein
MHAAPLIPFIRPAIDALKASLSAARKRLGKCKYEHLLSAAITELLKEHPDITAAEAQLAAVRATGVDPDASLLRAEAMLHSARRYCARTLPATGRKKLSQAMRARWAARRRAAPKRKPRKKSSGRKRAAPRKRKA